MKKQIERRVAEVTSYTSNRMGMYVYIYTHTDNPKLFILYLHVAEQQ